ncbi:putative glycosyltransferase EpsF [Crateriforma conspicua]|uniref:Putative glycosyltransferase EpsF n=1 Tax=Crateriforma conspicua TaxID=2527996 RepID=A0A5C5XZR5_9PLAN|nr:glycosyltransferase [Crateriforma conspicua]TWT68887.1 putative glycosyltransferase EpsF [Crateriforma conspicua]
MFLRRLFTPSSRYRPRCSGNRHRPLRCLFVITSMPVGGAETLLVNLMRRMNPDVVCPEVACLKDPGPLGQQIASEFPVHSNLIGGKYDIGVIRRLRRLIIDRNIDAVITVGAGDKMFWGRLAAAVAGVPVIASALHSTGWPDGVGRANRWLTGITDAFIAVADSHGKFLRQFERFPDEKVHVIRNGVDCEKFRHDESAGVWLRSEIGLDETSRLVGIVAALREEKNHCMLVHAAAQLRESHCDLHWVIVGDGPQRPEIESLADQLGVADRIHLLGTRHDTQRIVAGLDLFTLCSLNEASPVSILEALACQVAVVSTDVGSIGETVIEGETGMLVPSEDVDAYAAAIGRLIDDPAMRESMGTAGRKRVLATGSVDSMVTGYQTLITDGYDAVIRPRKATARKPRGLVREVAASR